MPCKYRTKLAGLSYNNFNNKEDYPMARFSSTLLGLLAAAALASSGLVFAAVPGMTGDNGTLTDHSGAALYTFDKDSDGKSVCKDQCATNWPPLTATAADKATGKWTVINRDDGSLQWAYDGKPVYLYKEDKGKGDVKGDGKGGVWHVVKP
jgi:predicted lipoprotein with Yx(FWY)xxD motif